MQSEGPWGKEQHTNACSVFYLMTSFDSLLQNGINMERNV